MSYMARPVKCSVYRLPNFAGFLGWTSPKWKISSKVLAQPSRNMHTHLVMTGRDILVWHRGQIPHVDPQCARGPLNFGRVWTK